MRPGCRVRGSRHVVKREPHDTAGVAVYRSHRYTLRMSPTRAALVVLALGLGACRAETTLQASDAGSPDASAAAVSQQPSTLCGPSEGGPQSVDPSALAQCTFDPSVGSVDAGAADCRVARMFVTCGGSQACALCLSDDGTCPNPTAAPVDGGAASFDRASCASECAPNEYAVECSGAKVPAGCRSKTGPAPGGGLVWSCCPCR